MTLTATSKEQLADQFGMEFFADFPVTPTPHALIEQIPYSFVKKHRILPIKEEGGVVIVATADPLNINSIDELRLILDQEVKTVYAKEEDIVSAINQFYHHKEGSASELIANLSESGNGNGNEEHTYDLLDVKEEAPIIRLLNLILSEAIEQGASDIHFEPFENDLKVRYRIDGVLQSRHSPSPEYQAQLLTRIKVLAKLDIAEHRLPQDGTIKLEMGGRQIDFRVSTVPVKYGERITLRILDKGNIFIGLDHLGLLPAVLDEFQKLISLPEGIILVTGPTGSGKTTTLYSALHEIYSDKINIMTIEDPVEYKLSGIAQMSIAPKIGLTFARGLRHILRQDPDIVMVGEIRDQETAEIATTAALTGHLVFSTLHTNDAPSAIPRLIDMGVEPYLLSSTIVGVLAQRLVRKICPRCRTRYIPSNEELSELGLTRDKLSGGVLYQGRGCEHCFHSGYLGRCGIYELLPVDQTMQSMIAARANSHELREAGVAHGFITLRKHGMHLVRAGITTTSEVMRVSKRY